MYRAYVHTKALKKISTVQILCHQEETRPVRVFLSGGHLSRAGLYFQNETHTGVPGLCGESRRRARLSCRAIFPGEVTHIRGAGKIQDPIGEDGGWLPPAIASNGKFPSEDS